MKMMMMLNPGDDESNWMMQMTLMGTFSVVSGAANLTVVAVILSSVRLRRSPHLYVANVLLLALVASLVSVPLRMMILSSSSSSSSTFNGNMNANDVVRGEGGGDFEHASALCQLSLFSAILSQFGIAYTLLAASFDRYVTVVHGRLNVRRCSGLVYVPIMLCVWALAFVTALLEVYGHAAGGGGGGQQQQRSLSSDRDDYECRATHMSVLSSVTWTFAIVFLGCWITSNVLYLRTYIHTRHCRRMRPYLRAPLVHNGWSDHDNGRQQQQQEQYVRQTPPSTTYGGASVVMVPVVHNPAASNKRHLFGVTALLNIICSVLWLPSLILCLLARLPSIGGGDNFAPIELLGRRVHSSVVDGGPAGHDNSTNVVAVVIVVVTACWMELLHVLVVPVLYVCSCSTFRKELLKIRNSYE